MQGAAVKLFLITSGDYSGYGVENLVGWPDEKGPLPPRADLLKAYGSIGGRQPDGSYRNYKDALLEIGFVDVEYEEWRDGP